MDILNNYGILFFLSAGALFSIFFAIKPVYLLWISTIFTLVIAGTIGYLHPSFKIASWIAYGAVALLYAPAILGFTKKKPVQFRFPSVLIVLFLILFILICTVSTIWSNAPLNQVIVASKSIFLFGGLWCFFANSNLSSQIVMNWLKTLLLIGLIQIFPVIYQFIVFRGWRVAHSRFKTESADAVVGTFGGSQLAGGGLGAVLVFFLIVSIIILLSMNNHRIFSWKKIWWIYLVLWLPILFTEVKVAFIYIPVGLFFLYWKYLFQKPGRVVIGLFFAGIILVGMLYSLQTIHLAFKGSDWKKNLTNAFGYSFQVDTSKEKGSGGRAQALNFWWQEHKSDKFVSKMIGHGLGSSRTQGQVLGFEAKYYRGNQLIDLTGLSLLLWDVGLVGTLLIYAILICFFILAGKLSNSAVLDKWQKALSNGLQAVIPLVAISLPYRNDIPYAANMMFIVMGIFGLLSWLNKQNVAEHYSILREERDRILK
nr:hypothetical protein [uncultured Desulfobacter sp.]